MRQGLDPYIARLMSKNKLWKEWAFKSCLLYSQTGPGFTPKVDAHCLAMQSARPPELSVLGVCITSP